MLRKMFLQIVSVAVIVSMLFGPLVSFAQAAYEAVQGPVQEAAQEAAQGAAPSAPSEQFNNWPYPQSPIDELDAPMDPVDAALKIATGGVIDAELLGGAVRAEPLSSQVAVGQVKSPSAPAPEVADPLTRLQAQQPQASNLQTFLDKNKRDEIAYDADIADQESTGPIPEWNESLKKLLGRAEKPVNVALTPVPAEVVDSSTSTSSSQIKPLPDTTTENTARKEMPFAIYLPLIVHDMSKISTPSPVRDETIITAAGGMLISTDSLIRVDVPADAYDEPFILRYTPAPKRGGLSKLEITTTGGEPIVLKRAARLSMRLPETRSGKPLFFRMKAQGQQRTVSVAASVMANTIVAPGEKPVTEEMLSAYVYELGEFTFASLPAKAFSSSYSALAVLDDGDNPDEGDDGLVIESLCFEPGSLGPTYTFAEAVIYTTTKEFDPWGYLNIFWDEIIGYDDEGNPIIQTMYDPNNPYREDQEKMVYGDDESLLMGLQEVGEYEPGTGLSFTFKIDDLGVPGGGCCRYDTMDEGLFQAGFTGCVSGSCEAVAPTIGAIRVAQSGQQPNSSFGTCWVSVLASDNSGAPSLSMTFNGQSYSNFQSLADGTMGVEVTECYLNDYNMMQVTAVDDCGNTSTTPEIPIWGTGAIGFGGLACGPNCGYQARDGDPVNTSNGNYYNSVTDIIVAGVGDSDLTLTRAYNSTAALWTGATEMEYSGFDGGGGYTEEPFAGPPQYFGPAWTFPYGTYLLIIDKAPLYTGVQIQYSDGRTVNFIKEGDAYAPQSPANFDTLTLEGGEYVLRHKRTLQVERFNAQGQLVATEDRNGNRITLTYDGEFLARVENDSGRWLEFEYNGDGLIETIQSPEGKTLRYGYTDGLLTSFTDARGNTTTYAYNDKKMLTAITTPKGHTSMEQTYDDKNRVNWQKAGRAAVNTFTYSADKLVTTVTDGYGHATIYTYNEIGQLVQTTDARSYTEEFGYDENYNRVYYKDKDGREWHYTLNEAGMRTAEDGPMGLHREWDYNDLNLATRMQDAEGRATHFEYDGKGNLVKIINAIDGISTIIYDERGLPTAVVDFNGNQTTNTYDPETGDLLETRNGAGDETGFTYDGLGRMRTMTDGIGSVYSYAYDGNDNLTSVAGPMGYHISHVYDANNNRTKDIDPNGGAIEYGYDESEQLTRVENQLDFFTVYEYDDMDNLARVEDAEGRVWTYEYNAVYNRIAEHGPEDTHTFFAYDGMRNLTDVTRCNSPLAGDDCAIKQTAHYEYDNLDRVVQMIQNYKPDTDETADTNVTTTYTYDLVGNLLTLTDANGNTTTYQYDKLDRLIRQEDAEHQITQYGYDANSNMISLINPRGYKTMYTYEGANRLETTTNALDDTWTYDYDGNGNMVDMTDPNDIVTHYDYDALNRLASLTQNDVPGAPATVDQNVTTRFAYDPAGNLRFVYDPRGTYQTEHRYDAAHRRTLTIDAEEGQTQFVYDKVNNLVSLIDANLHATTTQYDGLNRQVKVTNPEGHSVEFEYDRLGNLLGLTDARGNSTAFAYDGMNRIILRVDAMDGEWRYEYDAMGNLLRHVDANHHANNSYTYDKVYRALTITDAEGYTTRFTYDENGNRLTVTDDNNHTTLFAYDELDRLASMTNAENETTRYRYDAVGNQTHLIEADEIVTLYAYDPLYRLNVVTQNYKPGLPESADVNVDTHYAYDEVGNLLSILDAEEHTTRFSYDGLNRLFKEVDAEGNTWDYEYDPVGNRTVRIDAKRNRAEYEYYPDNQLKRVSYYDGTSVAYTYDENNNRLTMVDHLGKTTWVYDALNRVTDMTDPFNRHLGYAYDPVSNRTGLTYADGRTVSYGYYRNNWLKTATDPAGNLTMYERDGVGQVTRQLNPNNTIATSRYDKADRLLELVNYQVDGARKVNSAFIYTYNEVGHRTRTVAEYAWRKPNEIITTTYMYDSLRRLVRDEDSRGVWTDYTFDRVGNRLTLRTNDDSLSPRPFDEKTLFYNYNAINQVLTSVGNTHPGDPNAKRTDNVAQAIHAFRHEVTVQRGKHIEPAAADNLLAMVDTLLANLYDNPVPNIEEVTAAIVVLRTQVETDRAAGDIDGDGIANSLLVKLGFGDRANNGNSGEWQTTTFLYDANGNRINKEFPGPQGPRVQGTDYTYDPENRLVEALDYQQNLQGNRVDRAVTDLSYDGDGRRLVKVYDPKDGGGGAKRVEYVFDGLDPVAEYNIWNPQYENFYRADLGRIITMHHFPAGTHGQMYWFHYDGLGSTSGLTKQRGQSHHNYRYEPYGQIEMPPGNFTDPHNHYTFTGQELDENMGLYEFFARSYDYDTGMWLQQDVYRGVPREPQSFHRYQYVYNNPISYYDPRGYCIFGAPCPEVVKDIGNAVKEGAEWVGDRVEDGVKWVDQNKEQIAATVTGVAAGVGTALVVGALCGTGVGCLVVAGALAGAAAAGSGTIAANAIGGRDLSQNVLENTAIGFIAGGVAGLAFGAVTVGGTALAGTLGITSASAGASIFGAATIATGGIVAGQAYRATANILEGCSWDKGLFNPGDMAVDAIFSLVMYKGMGGKFNKIAPNPQDNYHGNSLKSTKTDYGYSLKSKSTDNVLKYGETTNPNTRYSKTYLDKNNAYMDIEISGSKSDIHNWQHQKILDYTDTNGVRPPLNKSDW